jgi:S1-C subfamily serine protease
MHVVRKLLPRLARGGVLRPGHLGVNLAEEEQGLKLTTVAEKNSKGEPTGARQAGLQVGDIIVKVNGTATKTLRDLRRVLSAHLAGDVVEIVLLRGGIPLTLKLTLSEP